MCSVHRVRCVYQACITCSVHNARNVRPERSGTARARLNLAPSRAPSTPWPPALTALARRAHASGAQAARYVRHVTYGTLHTSRFIRYMRYTRQVLERHEAHDHEGISLALQLALLRRDVKMV